MTKTSDILTKIAFSGMLIALLNFLCTYKSVPDDFKINPEKFRPFQPLGIIQPKTYEEVINIAFQKMSSGEKVPDINCAVKMDLTPEEINSLKTYILSEIKKTITTLPTPTKVAPLVGEEFSIIDVEGYFVRNTAVITFMLFHKRRHFGMNCRVIANKNTDPPNENNNPPWFIHKIQYASEDIYDKESKVKGFSYSRNIGTKVAPKLSVQNVGYPETLEPLLKHLQDSLSEYGDDSLSTLSVNSNSIDLKNYSFNINNLSDSKSSVLGNNIAPSGTASADHSNIQSFAEAAKKF